MGTEANNGTGNSGAGRPGWLLTEEQRAELMASQIPTENPEDFKPGPRMSPESQAVATITAQLLCAALPPAHGAGVLTRLEAMEDGCIGTAALMAAKIVQTAKEIIV